MLLVYNLAFKILDSQRTLRLIALFIVLRSSNLRITAFILFVWGFLSTLILRKLLLKEEFWLIIAFSLLFSITLLIAFLKKPKIITLKINLIIFTKALNVAFSASCFCQVFLALTLLNVKAKALLKSFLAFVIRLLSFSWPLISLITFAAVLALSFILL
jgi:hypothetical protein